MLGEGAAEEVVDAVGGVLAGGGGEVVEAVGGFGEDVELGFEAGGLPAGGHEEGVVEQGVEGADDEDGGGHVVQAGEQGGDVGVVAVGGVDVVVDEPFHDGAGEDEVALAPEACGGGVAEVEDAVDECGAAEAGVAMAVAHAQEGDGGEVSAGGFAADGEGVGAELGLSVLDEPGGGGFAVVVGCGPAVFGGEAVADGDDGLLGGLGAGPEALICAVVGADHPAAAVDVEVDAADGFGDEDADGDFAGGAGDGAFLGDVVEAGRGRAEGAALGEGVADFLGLHFVPGGGAGGEGFDHLVEGGGLGVGAHDCLIRLTPASGARAGTGGV